MSDPIQETRAMAEAHGLKFKDCGNGHVQISGHGQLVNYYPTSKNKTLYSPTLNMREAHCTPWDAITICMKGAKSGMTPKSVKAIRKGKQRPQHDFKKVITNPAGIQHLYDGEAAPWEGTQFICAQSDRIRLVANRARERAIRLEARARELDEIYQQQDPAELQIAAEARARI